MHVLKISHCRFLVDTFEQKGGAFKKTKKDSLMNRQRFTTESPKMEGLSLPLVIDHYELLLHTVACGPHMLHTYHCETSDGNEVAIVSQSLRWQTPLGSIVFPVCGRVEFTVDTLREACKKFFQTGDALAMHWGELTLLISLCPLRKELPPHITFRFTQHTHSDKLFAVLCCTYPLKEGHTYDTGMNIEGDVLLGALPKPTGQRYLVLLTGTTKFHGIYANTTQFKVHTKLDPSSVPWSTFAIKWNDITMSTIDSSGLYHSINDEPALVVGDQKGWYQHGVFHRLNGPAHIMGGIHTYYINGQSMGHAPPQRVSVDPEGRLNDPDSITPAVEWSDGYMHFEHGVMRNRHGNTKHVNKQREWTTPGGNVFMVHIRDLYSRGNDDMGVYMTRDGKPHNEWGPSNVILKEGSDRIERYHIDGVPCSNEEIAEIRKRLRGCVLCVPDVNEQATLHTVEWEEIPTYYDLVHPHVLIEICGIAGSIRHFKVTENGHLCGLRDNAMFGAPGVNLDDILLHMPDIAQCTEVSQIVTILRALSNGKNLVFS